MSVPLSTLGAEAMIIMGQSPSGDSYNKDRKGVPLLNGPSEFGPVHPIEVQWTTSPTKFCQPGDVLFCVRGATAGRLNTADKEYCIGRGLAAIRGRSGRFDGAFLRYVLANGYARFQSRGVGSTFINISADELANFPVPAFPLPEQRRIAEILDKADALRAKRRAALAKFETLTQSIFLDMFGDPATNPKGWALKRLDATCRLVNGRSFKPSEWEDRGLPIVRIQNLNDPTKPFNYTTQEYPDRFRVRSGDILFSWSGTPGTSFGCFRWHGSEGWLNQHIFNVRMNGVLEGEFFIAHVNLKLGELIAKAHGGVGLQHVTKGMVDETRLMIPARELQLEFARRMAAAQAVRTNLDAAQREIDILFSSLQHRAFKGTLPSDTCAATNV